MDLPVTFWILLISSLVLCVPAVQAAKCPQECFCDQIQLTVTCVNKNLTQVPPAVDEITVKLDLRGNDIQELPTGAFMHTPYLTHLSLQRCNIHKVKEGAFRGLGLIIIVLIPALFFSASRLPEVTRLDLSYNPMTYLGEEAVSMPKLTHLFLDHMSLQDLVNTAVSKSPNLIHLDISNNQLRVIQPFTEGSPKLYCSDCRKCKVEVLVSSTFPLPTCLQAETHHSSCENRGHTKVPRGFSASTRLLDLRGNNFHYIPSNSFPGVAQVVSLHLQRCKIVDVEGGAFSGMKGLIYLYLSENELTSLSPDAFKGLPKLTYLHLEKNRFTSFPKGVFKLVPSLLALHLENNSITKLEPGIMTGAEGLRALYLTGNAIVHVSPRALYQANDLDMLHLGGNKLKEVPTEALSKAGNLRDLRLSGNSIRWIGSNAFKPLGRSLKELYLNNMGLEKVSGALAGLGPGLRSLFLEGNQLEEVPDFHPLTALEVINLADNPLMCDCPLLPLRMWIEKVNLKVRATCANPPELRGRRVKDVHGFKACPGGESLPSAPAVTSKPAKAPKATKPKPMHLSGHRQVKMLKVKSKIRGSPNTKQGAAKKAAESTKRHSMP
uniref:Chondroadherin-like b n=1 Tax=Haplochromis burtoni TaxID=8153 RepID=A0A3Q3CEN7_HAPBU